MKKFLGFLFLCALVGGGWWWWSHRAGLEEAEARAAGQKPVFEAAATGPFRVVVEATGRVVPEQEVEIKCKASGTIVSLPRVISDVVTKGSLLVQLDPVDEKRSVQQAQVQQAQAQARKEQAQLNLTTAKANLATEKLRADAGLLAAQAKYADSKAKSQRTRQLVEKKMDSPEALETAVLVEALAAADLGTAQARMEELKTLAVQIPLREQDLQIAEQSVQASALALEIAQQRLTDTTVPAPIDGVVSEQTVQVGQIIASGINNIGGGTTVMKLADLSHIYVMVSVDESDIGRVALKQPVEVTVDAYPDVIFPGEVVQIATKGAVVANVVTFQVKVEIQGPQRALLKPEMTANVGIVAVDRPALTVPASAVVRQKRDWYVQVRGSGSTLERRIVKIGPNNGERVEIVEGLKPGEEVDAQPMGQQNRWQKGSGEPGTEEQDKTRRPARPEGHPE